MAEIVRAKNKILVFVKKMGGLRVVAGKCLEGMVVVFASSGSLGFVGLASKVMNKKIERHGDAHDMHCCNFCCFFSLFFVFEQHPMYVGLLYSWIIYGDRC